MSFSMPLFEIMGSVLLYIRRASKQASIMGVIYTVSGKGEVCLLIAFVDRKETDGRSLKKKNDKYAYTIPYLSLIHSSGWLPVRKEAIFLGVSALWNATLTSTCPSNSSLDFYLR